MGSNGSVIPFFNKMKETGVLPITDVEMTRFNISLDEGVDLVFYSLEKSIGGEIFIPKIPSYNILDIANAIAPNCKKKIVGIRPGEKLHEDMVSFEESLRCVEYEKYFLITDKIMPETKDGYTYSSSDRVLSEEQVRDFLIEKGVI